MTPKLTLEQCEALDRCTGPLPVEDVRTHRLYYVIDETTLTNLQEQENLAAIREGIADMEAGRVVTLDELDVRIRTRLGLQAK